MPEGAPLAVSFPHFYQAHPDYQQVCVMTVRYASGGRILGRNPDKSFKSEYSLERRKTLVTFTALP
jgi:hypothetical protein